MGIFKIAAGKKPKKGANADINASTAQTAAVTETTENTATCNETLAFNAMYGGILNALKAEGNGFVGMTDDEIYDMLSGMLRPAFDRAVQDRMREGGRLIGQIASDANERGVGSSSYVQGELEEAREDTASDIALLEQTYAQELANGMYEALRRRNSAGRNGGISRQNQSTSIQGNTLAEMTAYFDGLPAKTRRAVLFSTDPYWEKVRAKLRSALGKNEFERLLAHYRGSRSSGAPYRTESTVN